MEARPDAVQPRVLLGRLHLRSSRPQEALALAESALADNPKAPPLLEIVGLARLALDDSDGAVAAFRDLVSVQPESGQAAFLLARAYAGTGNGQQVRIQLENAVERDKEHFDARVALARLLLDGDETEAARKVAAEAAALRPESIERAEIDGRLALADGDPKRAVALLTQARTKLDSQRLTLWLAAAHWQAAERAQSAGALEEWLSRHPDDTTVRLRLNGYYMALGRAADARANLTRVLEYEPDNWMARNDLAWMQFREGDLATAAANAEHAYRLAPDNPLVMDTLGVIGLEQANVKEAASLLRKAAEGAADNPQVR